MARLGDASARRWSLRKVPTFPRYPEGHARIFAGLGAADLPDGTLAGGASAAVGLVGLAGCAGLMSQGLHRAQVGLLGVGGHATFET